MGTSNKLRLFWIALGIAFLQSVSLADEKSDASLNLVLASLAKKQVVKLNLDDGRAIVVDPHPPADAVLEPFRVEIGLKVRVLQGGKWKALDGAEFDTALDMYCMASREVSPVLNIRLEIGANTDAKLLFDIMNRLSNFHLERPQTEPIQRVCVAKAETKKAKSTNQTEQ